MEGSNKLKDLEDIFNQPINDQDVKDHRLITPPVFSDATVVFGDDHHGKLPSFPFPDQGTIAATYLSSAKNRGMGDKEACEDCKEKCSLFHGKETDPSPLVTSFTKILFGNYDISKDLFLPAKISQAIPVLAAGESCTLQDSNAQRWDVKLGTEDGRLAFREGWNQFYEDHGLKVGYVLAFHYIINSHFVVQIFDSTGFEKLRFPVANRKKRKRSEIDGNCLAVVECPNLSNHSTEKHNASLPGTSDSEARAHGQLMFKDTPLSLETENGKYQHVASVNCDADTLCVINRDVVSHHEEDRTPLLNLLNSEMQSGVIPDGISDERSRPSNNTLTESDAVAGIVNEKPVSAKVANGEPPAEVAAASTLSNNNNTCSERENVEEVDNDYRGRSSKVSSKRVIKAAARNRKQSRIRTLASGIGLEASSSEGSLNVGQHRVLIFAQHKAFLDIIEKDLFNLNKFLH